MKRKVFVSAGILASTALIAMLQPATPVQAANKQASANASGRFCSLPTTPAASPEQTAWQIFTAVNCTTNGQFAWESWTEQTCLLKPSTPGCASNAGKKRFLHASRLHVKANANANGLQGLANDCSPMITPASFSGKNPPDPSLKPFVPKNLAATATFCEEVFVNDADAAFIKTPVGAAAGVNLQTLKGQAPKIKRKAN